jgi:hypothetical protein
MKCPAEIRRNSGTIDRVIAICVAIDFLIYFNFKGEKLGTDSPFGAEFRDMGAPQQKICIFGL